MKSKDANQRSLPKPFECFDLEGFERFILGQWGPIIGKIDIVKQSDLPERQTASGFQRLALEFDELGGGKIAPAPLNEAATPTGATSLDQHSGVSDTALRHKYALDKVTERLLDSLVSMMARGELPGGFTLHAGSGIPDAKVIAHTLENYKQQALTGLLGKRLYERWWRFWCERPRADEGLSSETMAWFPNQSPPREARRFLIDHSTLSVALRVFVRSAFRLSRNQFRHPRFVEAQRYQDYSVQTPTGIENWTVMQAQTLADLCRVIGERMEGADGRGTNVGETSHPADEDGAWLSEADLAKKFGVNANTLRTRLRAWRPKHHDGEWQQVENPKPRAPQYLYRVGAVKPLLVELKTGQSPTSKKKPQ